MTIIAVLTTVVVGGWIFVALQHHSSTPIQSQLILPTKPRLPEIDGKSADSTKPLILYSNAKPLDGIPHGRIETAISNSGRESFSDWRFLSVLFVIFVILFAAKIMRNVHRKPLSGEVLLAFLSHKKPMRGKLFKKMISIDFETASHNVIIFGATGSGKTSGVIAPALEGLMSNGCFGVVLDVKGDYTSHLAENHEEKIHIIGPGNNAIPTNIIGGFTPEMLKSFLSDIKIQDRDEYWGSSAIEDCLLVQCYIRCTEHRDVNIADLYDALIDPHNFCGKLRYCAEIPALSVAIKSRLRDAFSVLYVGGYIKSKSEKIHEQYAWHTNKILPIIAPFSVDNRLKQNLCSETAPSWADILYRDKKTVLLDMSSVIFGGAAFTASKAIRIACTTAIMTCSDVRRKKAGIGTSAYTFMIIDEYQQYVQAKKGGARSSQDDNTWLDRSRSFGHINIFATQGIDSLYAQGNVDAVNSLLQNFRTQIFLSTNNPNTVHHIAMIADSLGVKASSHYKNSVVFPTTKGQGVIYCGVVQKRHGGTLISEMRTGPISSCPHMGMFFGERVLYGIDHYDDVKQQESDYFNDIYEQPINLESKASRKTWNEDEEDYIINSDEQSIDQEPNAFHKKWTGKVHVITTPSSRGCDDFVHAYKLHYTEKSPKELIQGASLDVHTVSAKADPSAWVSVLRNVIEKAASTNDEADAIVFVRGGGDIKSDEFAVFNSEILNKAITNNPGFLYISGIAHARDKFEIDKAVHYACITPTDAGARLACIAHNAQHGAQSDIDFLYKNDSLFAKIIGNIK